MASTLSYIQRDGCDSHRNVHHPLETRDFQEQPAQRRWSLEWQTGSDRPLTEHTAGETAGQHGKEDLCACAVPGSEGLRSPKPQKQNVCLAEVLGSRDLWVQELNTFLPAHLPLCLVYTQPEYKQHQNLKGQKDDGSVLPIPKTLVRSPGPRGRGRSYYPLNSTHT